MQDASTTFALAGRAHMAVEFNADANRVVVSDFKSYVIQTVDNTLKGELRTAHIKQIKVVRQVVSGSGGGWVVTDSSVRYVPRFTHIRQLLVDGKPTKMTDLPRPTRLTGVLLPGATALSKIEIISNDVSPVVLAWPDMDGQLSVASAYASSTGLVVSRSPFTQKIPAGTVITGVSWSDTSGRQQYPASLTTNIADEPMVVDAYAAAAEKLKPGGDENDTTNRMWRAAAMLSLFDVLVAVGEVSPEGADLADWTVNVRKRTPAYAAGARLGHTVLAVQGVPIVQSAVGVAQFRAHRSMGLPYLNITLARPPASTRDGGRLVTVWKARQRQAQLITLITLTIWSQSDVDEIEDNLSLDLSGSSEFRDLLARRVQATDGSAIPSGLLGFASDARRKLHREWRVKDTGTSGAGVKALKKAYCIGLASLCMTNPDLAQTVLPAGVLQYDPLQVMKQIHTGLSAERMRHAHEILLLVMQLVMFAAVGSTRVRLQPLAHFPASAKDNTGMYGRLLSAVIRNLAPTGELPVSVALQRRELVYDGRPAMVVVGANLITPSTSKPLTVDDLRRVHPNVVNDMLRLGDAPPTSAGDTDETAQLLSTLRTAFGGAPKTGLVAHMLSRNKVKWTKTTYTAVVRVVQFALDDIEDTELRAWASMLQVHLSTTGSDMLWYARTTISDPPRKQDRVGGERMRRLVMPSDPEASTRFDVLKVRVVAETDKKAILDRVYKKRPACVNERALRRGLAPECDSVDDVPVTQEERLLASQKKVGESKGMVGMGINKLEAFVRARYWGISRADISNYLKNKEERQLRAQPLVRSGMRAQGLVIGQAVRVATTAGITFFRYEASKEVQERQSRYKKSAADYIKGGKSALPTRWSSRLYKVSARHEVAIAAPPDEGKVCRFWQGDSSFFGAGENYRWWPTHRLVPPQPKTKRKRGEKAGNAEICYGYVAFIDVFSKYIWLEPLFGQKKSVRTRSGELTWRVHAGSGNAASQRCFKRAVEWCQTEYNRTHPLPPERVHTGTALVGGGREGFPWAPRHTQTDNGQEFAGLASSKRPLTDVGAVYTHYDLPTWMQSDLKDRLNHFQKTIYHCGGVSHGTPQPSVSFQKQRDIETGHKGIKGKLYDIIHADPKRYNVRKLASNKQLQADLLNRACELYNHAPHRSLPQSGSSQQLTPASVMRYMLQKHNDVHAAVEASSLRTQIQDYRAGLANRQAVDGVDRAMYTVKPLRTEDYVVANQRPPKQFAFPDEYTHTAHTRFRRHELMPIDLTSMEPMYKDQQSLQRASTEAGLTHTMVLSVNDQGDEVTASVQGVRRSSRLQKQSGVTGVHRAQEQMAAENEAADAVQDELDEYDETGGQESDVEEDDLGVLTYQALQQIETVIANAKTEQELVNVQLRIDKMDDTSMFDGEDAAGLKRLIASKRERLRQVRLSQKKKIR